jgi:hypothetical protein
LIKVTEKGAGEGSGILLGMAIYFLMPAAIVLGGLANLLFAWLTFQNGWEGILASPPYGGIFSGRVLDLVATISTISSLKNNNTSG